MVHRAGGAAADVRWCTGLAEVNTAQPSTRATGNCLPPARRRSCKQSWLAMELLFHVRKGERGSRQWRLLLLWKFGEGLVLCEGSYRSASSQVSQAHHRALYDLVKDRSKSHPVSIFFYKKIHYL